MSGEFGVTVSGMCLPHGQASQSYLYPSKPGDFHSPAGVLNIISLSVVLWLISALHAAGKGPPGPYKDHSLF